MARRSPESQNTNFPESVRAFGAAAKVEEGFIHFIAKRSEMLAKQAEKVVAIVESSDELRSPDQELALNYAKQLLEIANIGVMVASKAPNINFESSVVRMAASAAWQVGRQSLGLVSSVGEITGFQVALHQHLVRWVSELGKGSYRSQADELPCGSILITTEILGENSVWQIYQKLEDGSLQNITDELHWQVGGERLAGVKAIESILGSVPVGEEIDGQIICAEVAKLLLPQLKTELQNSYRVPGFEALMLEVFHTLREFAQYSITDEFSLNVPGLYKSLMDELCCVDCQDEVFKACVEVFKASVADERAFNDITTSLRVSKQEQDRLIRNSLELATDFWGPISKISICEALVEENIDDLRGLANLFLKTYAKKIAINESFESIYKQQKTAVDAFLTHIHSGARYVVDGANPAVGLMGDKIKARILRGLARLSASDEGLTADIEMDEAKGVYLFCRQFSAIEAFFLEQNDSINDDVLVRELNSWYQQQEQIDKRVPSLINVLMSKHGFMQTITDRFNNRLMKLEGIVNQLGTAAPEHLDDLYSSCEAELRDLEEYLGQPVIAALNLFEKFPNTKAHFNSLREGFHKKQQSYNQQRIVMNSNKVQTRIAELLREVEVNKLLIERLGGLVTHPRESEVVRDAEERHAQFEQEILAKLKTDEGFARVESKLNTDANTLSIVPPKFEDLSFITSEQYGTKNYRAALVKRRDEIHRRRIRVAAKLQKIERNIAPFSQCLVLLQTFNGDPSLDNANALIAFLEGPHPVAPNRTVKEYYSSPELGELFDWVVMVTQYRTHKLKSKQGWMGGYTNVDAWSEWYKGAPEGYAAIAGRLSDTTALEMLQTECEKKQKKKPHLMERDRNCETELKLVKDALENVDVFKRQAAQAAEEVGREKAQFACDLRSKNDELEKELEQLQTFSVHRSLLLKFGELLSDFSQALDGVVIDHLMPSGEDGIPGKYEKAIDANSHEAVMHLQAEIEREHQKLNRLYGAEVAASAEINALKKQFAPLNAKYTKLKQRYDDLQTVIGYMEKAEQVSLAVAAVLRTKNALLFGGSQEDVVDRVSDYKAERLRLNEVLNGKTLDQIKASFMPAGVHESHESTQLRLQATRKIEVAKVLQKTISEAGDIKSNGMSWFDDADFESGKIFFSHDYLSNSGCYSNLPVFEAADLTLQKINFNSQYFKPGSKFKNVIFENCIFQSCKIAAEFENVTFKNCTFKNRNASEVTFSQSKFKNVLFDECSFEASPDHVCLVNFTGAKVDDVTFRNCEMSGIDWAANCLSDAHYEGCEEVPYSLTESIEVLQNRLIAGFSKPGEILAKNFDASMRQKLRMPRFAQAVSADLILEILECLNTTFKEHGASNDKLVMTKKAAMKTIDLLLPHIGSLKELVKLHDLVANKHADANNKYGFIRKERSWFRAEFGNTNTWAHIMRAIKARAEELVKSRDENAKRLSPEQYKNLTAIMRTRTRHTWGFGKMPGTRHSMGAFKSIKPFAAQPVDEDRVAAAVPVAEGEPIDVGGAIETGRVSTGGSAGSDSNGEERNESLQSRHDALMAAHANDSVRETNAVLAALADRLGGKSAARDAANRAAAELITPSCGVTANKNAVLGAGVGAGSVVGEEGLGVTLEA